MPARWGPLATAAGATAAVAAAWGLVAGGQLGPARHGDTPVQVVAPRPLPTLGVDPGYVPTDQQNGTSDTASRMAHLKRWK